MCPLSSSVVSLFLCLLLVQQFTGSPIDYTAVSGPMIDGYLQIQQPGLEETAGVIDLTDGVIVANSRARRQQSSTTQCSSNLQLSTDKEFSKKLAMSDSGNVTVVSSNCSDDTIIEELIGVRPSLVRIRFRNGYLGVAGTNVSAHDIDNPSDIKPDDACLWCETGNSEQGFRFRYFSPSMNVCTDDQAPELYLAVTATDDVIISTSSFRNMSSFFRACDNQCT